MPVSQQVVDAYIRLYTREQLETALAKALSDRATGVQVTQVSFQDGGGSGQVIAGDPNEIIETMEICLKRLDGALSAGPPPLASAINFSFRRSET